MAELKVVNCPGSCDCSKCKNAPLYHGLRLCIRCKKDECPDRNKRPCTVMPIDDWRRLELKRTYWIDLNNK